MGRFSRSSEDDNIDDNDDDDDNDKYDNVDDEHIKKVEAKVVPTSGRSPAGVRRVHGGTA